jgi:HAE1 family hydrophobic/amphiphilic exporter-1
MTAQATAGYTSGELMSAIENVKLPSNYHIEWTDMSYQERQNQ